MAKEIALKNLLNPPTLLNLSKEINLSLKKLKEGFKKIYGKTVYQFLLDHKMELAKKLLSERKKNVNEVSIKLGYSTASHFIAAFKNKYGVEKSSRKYVYDLFPYGYGQQACKIAGMRQPKKLWLDM